MMRSMFEPRLPRQTLPEVVRFLRLVESSPDERGKLVSASGEPLRVMVVEDDGMVSAVFRDIVEGFGGEVVATVTSGLASVGAADGTRPDIIIMDIGLPGMDGIDAAGIIRSRYSIPIVFVSGLDVGDELARRLGESGGIELLLKPIDPESLLQALLKAYSGPSRRT
jgi:CheY-like chemotaxis protein